MKDTYLRNIKDCSDELSHIQDWIRRNPIDSNVKYLVAYAVVKSSGTIEIVLKSMVHYFLSKDTKKETRLFIEKNTVDASFNPRTGSVEKLLDSFNAELKEQFVEQIKQNEVKQNVNSLVSLRNDIAHGRSISITINNVIEYYNSGVAMLDIVYHLLFQEYLLSE